MMLGPLFAYSQTGKIVGKVIDAQTLKPLAFANVYLSNTTIGTTSSDVGEFTLKNIPLGVTEIVFSFIGYTSQQIKIEVANSNNKPLAILLAPDETQLMEVEVKEGRDKAWEKKLKKFEGIFLGTIPNCKILNPWVIDFRESNGALTAKASQPIEIENRYLGYKIFYQLKSFIYTATQFSITGNSRFVEIETSDQSVALKWTSNRENVYRGSLQHLMKSLLNKEQGSQGFLMYKEKVRGVPRSDNFSAELKNNLAPIDTIGLVSRGTRVNEYRINLKDKIEVHYHYGFTSTSFYTDLNFPVSWIEVRGSSVSINSEGIVLNSVDIAVSGSMAEARIGSILPLDYKPGNLTVVQSPQNILAKRLQEKVYVHTDKPYYYVGESIWFNAYINYQVPALMDTLSKVLYVELIDSEKKIINSLILPIDSGRASSAINIPLNKSGGNYLLRAYTQWMRNYDADQLFVKPIKILNINENADLIPTKPIPNKIIKIAFDTPSYKPRSQVKATLSIDSTQLDGNITGNFSVSIFDETLVVPCEESISIKTNFEITNSPKIVTTEFKYTIEKGLSFKGTYIDKKRKGKKTDLIFLPESLNQVYKTTALPSGEFSLQNILFYDSVKFIVQPAAGKITIANRDTPLLPEPLPKLGMKVITRQKEIVFKIDTTKAKLLEQINVTAKKVVRYENSYAEPDLILNNKDIQNYASAADAIASRVPAFKLVFDQTSWLLVWTRGNITSKDGSPAEPALYIDNVLVVGSSAGDRLIQLNPFAIDRIEVKGMIGSNLGANGANGLISVFTKKAEENTSSNKALPTIKLKGFDREQTFKMPNYNDQSLVIEKDFRTTLYWNPTIKLSTQASTEISFFTSDQEGNKRVVLEGVTANGKAIRAEAVFYVE